MTRILSLFAVFTVCSFLCLGATRETRKSAHLSPQEVNKVLKQRLALSQGDVKNEYNKNVAEISPLKEEEQALREWREFSSTYNTNTMHIFDMLKQAVKGRENLFKETLRPMFARLEDGEATLNEIIVGLREANNVDDEEEDRVICTVCYVLVGALKAAAAVGTTWDDIYPPLYLLCITAGPLIVPHLRADVLCEGTLQLQGPYAFDAITRTVPFTTPSKHCEFLNACFPNVTLVQDAKSDQVLKEPIQTNRAHVESVPAIVPRKRGQLRRARRDLSDALKVVQLTDIHVEENYKQDSLTDCKLPVCCLEKWGAGNAGPYGDYVCNIPERTIDLFVDKVAELDPDFIVYSGDNPPHTVWEETPWSQWNSSRLIINAFRKKLSGYNIYPNIGNHESYPTNIYFPDLNYTKEGAHHFTEWWAEFAKFSADNNKTMDEGSYYSLLAVPGLRIISYNTNFMYSFNWYNPVQDNIRTNNVLRQMETFMENTLAAAKTAGEKVLIIGHHPPGKSDYIVQFSRWLTALHIQYSDIIVLHMCGHTHKDEFRLFKDQTGTVQEMVYVAPSVTSQNYLNPSIRMYYLDKTTFDVLDYENYFLDLQQVVALNPVPTIELSYRATEEYGLSDLTPSSWADLVDRMKTDDTLFMKYHRNYYSRAPPGINCDPIKCKTEHLCMVSNSNYDEYRKCVRINTPSTTTVTTSPSTTTTSTTVISTNPTTLETSGSSPVQYLMFFLIFCSCFVSRL